MIPKPVGLLILIVTLLSPGLAHAALDDIESFPAGEATRTLKIIDERHAEIAFPGRHRLVIEVGYLTDSSWDEETVYRALGKANDLLGACDIGFSAARIQAVAASGDYHVMDNRKLSELAALFDDYDSKKITLLFATPMKTDILGFNPWHGAAYSEAVVASHGGSEFQKNKLFVSSAALHEPVVIPHELTHILCNHPSCGYRNSPGYSNCSAIVHSTDINSYMHRSARSASIDAEECRLLVQCGIDNGFFE